MLFPTLEFLFAFLPLAVLIYHWLPARLGIDGKWVLLGISLIFIGMWKVQLLALILLSVTLNFYVGLALQQRYRAWLYFTGIFFNLCLLGYYKYAFWLTGNSYFESLALPLGISFWTFQQIAYLTHVKHNTSFTHSFRDYFLYICFFPQLIAGPIVDHPHFVSQLALRLQQISYQNTYRGLLFILIGCSKKILLADNLGSIADPFFDSPESHSAPQAAVGIIAYTFQIYFDFSGYCDIAIGVALMFGIALPQNFNRPYLAENLTHFWRRWHITLGEFFKKHLYIPLGGSRGPFINMILALLATMLLSGFWHGADITFIVWGGLHFVGLLAHKLWIKQSLRLPSYLAICLTFLFVVLAWVPFRATDMDNAIAVYQVLFSWKDFYIVNLAHVLVMSLLALWVFKGPGALATIQQSPTLARSLALGILCVLVTGMLNQPEEFIYFVF